MGRRIFVHLLPDLTTDEELAGQTAVVIDVLRATTTLAFAFASGAECVIPCLTVDEAKRHAARQMETILGQVELDGSFVDAQMQGKATSTAMALLTLAIDLDIRKE